MMMDSPALIWIVIIGAVIAGVYLYKQGKIPWLKGIKMPRMFEPKPEDQVERLKAQTEKEKTEVEKLRGVLEAKRERDSVIAEKIKLRREIESTSPKSVGRAEREAEEREREAQKAKPKRL